MSKCLGEQLILISQAASFCHVVRRGCYRWFLLDCMLHDSGLLHAASECADAGIAYHYEC